VAKGGPDDKLRADFGGGMIWKKAKGGGGQRITRMTRKKAFCFRVIRVIRWPSSATVEFGRSPPGGTRSSALSISFRNLRNLVYASLRRRGSRCPQRDRFNAAKRHLSDSSRWWHSCCEWCSEFGRSDTSGKLMKSLYFCTLYATVAVSLAAGASVFAPNPQRSSSTPMQSNQNSDTAGGPDEPLSVLAKYYVGVATYTSSLENDLRRLKTTESGEDSIASRTKILTSATDNAKRLEKYLVSLRPLAPFANNQPAVQEVIKKADKRLAEFDRLRSKPGF
jgi:hypothetical protein